MKASEFVKLEVGDLFYWRDSDYDVCKVALVYEKNKDESLSCGVQEGSKEFYTETFYAKELMGNGTHVFTSSRPAKEQESVSNVVSSLLELFAKLGKAI